jgi:hypothetical protein
MLSDKIREAAANPGGIQMRARHFPAQPLRPGRAQRRRPPDDVRAFASSVSISLAERVTAPLD